jgi:hypothetical protein
LDDWKTGVLFAAGTEVAVFATASRPILAHIGLLYKRYWGGGLYVGVKETQREKGHMFTFLFEDIICISNFDSRAGFGFLVGRYKIMTIFTMPSTFLINNFIPQMVFVNILIQGSATCGPRNLFMRPVT